MSAKIILYSCRNVGKEALEHGVFPKNVLKGLLCVTKPGGEVVVIDRNKSAMGLRQMSGSSDLQMHQY